MELLAPAARTTRRLWSMAMGTLGAGQGLQATPQSEHATVAEAFAALDAISAKMMRTGTPSNAIELVVVDENGRQVERSDGSPAISSATRSGADRAVNRTSSCSRVARTSDWPPYTHTTFGGQRSESIMTTDVATVRARLRETDCGARPAQVARSIAWSRPTESRHLSWNWSRARRSPTELH